MGESVHVEARLTCGHFHAGGAVRGYVKIESPRKLYIEWGVVQVHGHLCVDSDVLTIPIMPVTAMDESFMKSLNLPDVKTFSGPTGICIYQGKPTVLYSEIDVERSTTSHFATGLPAKMCPSFKGTSARVFYVLSFTFKVQGTQKIQTLHLPFDIYAGVTSSTFQFAPPLRNDATTMSPSSPVVLVPPPPVGLMSPTDDVRAIPVAVRHGHEIPFEVVPRVMHGRVDTERLGGTHTRHFTIGQASFHLVQVTFVKQTYMPGDVVLVAFDFSKATQVCKSISASLIVEERLGALSLDPGRVVNTHTLQTAMEATAGMLHTHVGTTPSSHCSFYRA
ncbi:hypothetical protein, variant [Aphanomyces invadans]|uniref:Arrestin-like N-terminal domain-containing protein n=1 Tax=Aphanomyces invadans TaxID=157072 RepID=A0A024U062_9STRA|nr:hypothetical protein, variant [Aphanomyces invadans]ETV98972.1 hypothetical protein, variant [Aphanomyces invadans]|eukprot:XP_008872399.1 hypothetical protein, variant [Aphanomyces invadans]